MKLSIKSLLLIFLVTLTVSDAFAQSRRSSRSSRSRVRGEEKEAKPTFAENLNYEIKLGNIGIGSSFAISLKPSVGYKFHKIASAGLGSRLYYTFINRVGPDQSFLDYGFFGYGRVKLGQNFYLQGEYTTYSLDYDVTRTNLLYPLFGLGYQSGYSDWTFGAELLFIGSEEARENIGSVVEWWFSASYNF